MKKIYIDYIINNNDERIKKENIEAKYKENEYLKIIDEEENINITFDNGNIIMERDSIDSNIIFNFILNKETESKYFIKDLNFYINTKVITNNIIVDNNKILIEYELYLQDEYSGKFKYEITIKED